MSPKPATFEITKLFVELQELRESRAIILKDGSHSQQRTEAVEEPLHEFIALTLLPITDAEDVMFNLSWSQPFAGELDVVELPPRVKLIPLKTSWRPPPALRGPLGWLQMLLYIGLAVSAYYGMWVRSKNEGLAANLEVFCEARDLPPKTMTAPAH